MENNKVWVFHQSLIKEPGFGMWCESDLDCLPATCLELALGGDDEALWTANEAMSESIHSLQQILPRKERV